MTDDSPLGKRAPHITGGAPVGLAHRVLGLRSCVQFGIKISAERILVLTVGRVAAVAGRGHALNALRRLE
jgi:hypothetical protein